MSEAPDEDAGPAGSGLGLVIGTVPATPLQFSVGLAPGQYAQLDDVVVTSRPIPGQGSVRIAGVVTNVEAVHEGARFASDVFLIAGGALPAEVCEVAEVSVTRVEPELYVPPLPGAAVRRAAGPARDSALYFDEMGASKVPVGFGRDGEPVYVNFEFLDGTRGAHVSISGVSGIATKTSFAMFLLHAIANCGVLADQAHNTKALVFSVKGEDLLFLDYANSRLTPAQRARYAGLGLPAAPFGNVRVFAPPRKNDPSGTPDVHARDRAVSPFYWTIAEFCEQELLPFAFADAEDERAQYTMLIAQVAARLRRDATPAGTDGAVRVHGVDQARSGIVRTFSELVDLLEAELGDEGTRGSWVSGSTVTGSVNALLRRLRSAVPPLSVIVRGDLAHRGERSISTSRAQVTVVDLHNLPDRAQRFVVGVTLRAEFARKERQGTARPLMFVMLDELNKYAPREGDSPIKQILLDLAERGRSLGVILIGAQQTASEVERRILANCAIRVACGWMRPRRCGPSTATCRPPSVSGPRWPSRARCSSPSPISRCRSPSTSRSRPGRPGRARKGSGPGTTAGLPGRLIRSRRSRGPATRSPRSSHHLRPSPPPPPEDP